MTPDELRKMVAEATKAPWHVVNYPNCPGHPWIEAACNFSKRADGSDYYLSVSGRISQEDARLIAAAPTLALALAEAMEALEWYHEQTRLARLIHKEGDAGRNALANDGGKRARAALDRIKEMNL